MKYGFTLRRLPGFLCAFACGSALAQSPAPTDIPLGAPTGFSATTTNAVGNGRYCVSGFVYDDAGPSESAFVLLVDATNRQVVWRTPIPHGHDYVGSSATRCLSDGNAYYAITQENTNSSESLNQTRVVINKISDKGKLLQQQTIKAGFDEWSYLLDVQPNLISVGGGTSATLDRGGKFSTFITQFDSNLTETKTVKLDSGAFWIGSTAKLDHQHLLVSGQFLPNTASSGHEAFAASKIDLGSGKYTWSNYASPTDAQQAASVFAADGSTYVAALSASNLAVSVVDPAGKTVSSFSVSKPLCGIDALTFDGHLLKAIGASCKGESSSVIADIDPKAKTASVVKQLDTEVAAPQFDGQGWVGIVAAKGHGKVFRRGAQ